MGKMSSAAELAARLPETDTRVVYFNEPTHSYRQDMERAAAVAGALLEDIPSVDTIEGDDDDVQRVRAWVETQLQAGSIPVRVIFFGERTLDQEGHLVASAYENSGKAIDLFLATMNKLERSRQRTQAARFIFALLRPRQPAIPVR